MKKTLALSVALLIGFTVVFSGLKVNAQDATPNYNELLQQFIERLSGTNPNPYTPTPETISEPVWTPQGQDTLTGHVTRTESGEVFLKDQNGRTYRLQGRVMANQILRAVIYDQVQVVGTLNKTGTVLGAITQVNVMSDVTNKYVKPLPTASPWNMKTYTGWIIKDAQGHVFLRLNDGRDSSKVMVSGGVPVEYRLLNSVNWRLAFQFVGKGLVRVTGIAHDGKRVLRYNDGNSIENF